MDGEVEDSTVEFHVTATELANAFEESENDGNHEHNTKISSHSNIKDSTRNECLQSPHQKSAKWEQPEESGKWTPSDQHIQKRKHRDVEPNRKKSSPISKTYSKPHSSATIVAEEKLKEFEKSKPSENISKSGSEEFIVERKVTESNSNVNFKTSHGSSRVSRAHPTNKVRGKPATLGLHLPGDSQQKNELKNNGGNAPFTYQTTAVNTQGPQSYSNSYAVEDFYVTAKQDSPTHAHDPEREYVYNQGNQQFGYNTNSAYHNPDQYGTYYFYVNSSSGYPSATYDSSNYYGSNYGNTAGSQMGYANYYNNNGVHTQTNTGIISGQPANQSTEVSVNYRSIDFKTVTHPLLPSAQQPLVQALPIPTSAPQAAVISSHLSSSEQLLTEKLVHAANKCSNIVAGRSLSQNEQALIKKPFNYTDVNALTNSEIELSTKKPRGEISILVENIHPDVNLSGFKKVLQAFGRLPGFVIHKRAAGAPSSNLTATFANIEGASRAVRVLSKLSIGHLKITAKYEGDIIYHKPLTKLEQSRDKDLKSTITRLLNHEDPMRPVKFDDPEDSANKVALIAQAKDALKGSNHSNSSYSSSSSDKTIQGHQTSEESSMPARGMCETSRSKSCNRTSPASKWSSKRSRTPDRRSTSVRSKSPVRSSRSKWIENSERSRSLRNRTPEQYGRKRHSRTPVRSYRSSRTEYPSHRSKSRERQSRSNKSSTPHKESSSKYNNESHQKGSDSAWEKNSENCPQRKNKKENLSQRKNRSPAKAMSSAPQLKTVNLEAEIHPPILDGYNIHVDGGLKKLSKIAVNEINKIFGGAVEPIFQRVWHLSISNQKSAQLLVQALHGYRLLDDRLQVTFADGTSVARECGPEEVSVWREAAAVALTLHDSAISQLLVANLDKTLDIFLFKLEPCRETHCEDAVCNKFHSLRDKRRDPRIHFYRPLKCPEGWQGRRCPRDDDCELCHSETELQLHSSTFRAKLCPHKICKDQLCPYAHKETPELFYHSQWNDLFIEGLHNTLYYVAGALRNLCKLDDAITGLQILAVTSSADVALRITGLLQDTALRHGVKVTAIATGDEDPSGAHALFGTVKGLLMLLDKRGTAPLLELCALIIDDASHILQNKDQTVSLLRLLQLVKDVHKDIGRVNKVLIGQEVPKKGVGFLEVFLATTFTVVEFAGSAGGRPVVTKKLASTEVCVQRGLSKQSTNPLSEMTKSENINSKIANYNKLDKLENSANDIKKIRREDKSSVGDDGKKMPRFTSHVPPAKRYKNSVSAPKILCVMSSKELTPLHYCAEEKALREELDNVYAAYIDVPEMHPSYSAKYNAFLKIRRVTGSVSEAEWAEYWRLELEQMKKNELAERKKPIIAKYKQMVGLKTSMRSSANSEPITVEATSCAAAAAYAQNENNHSFVSISSTNYCVIDSFVVLEGLADHIGLLGAALKGLIDLARKAGSTTKKAFDLLLQDDSVTLINLCISKLKKELVHATLPFSLHLNQGVEHAEKLLKFVADEVKKSEKVADKKENFGLALQAIAKATEGQSSSYIVDFIKCSLDIQSAAYTKKDLNELFLAVSSLHFEMSLNACPQSVNDVAPESISSQAQGWPTTNSVSTVHAPSTIQQASNLINYHRAPTQLDKGLQGDTQIVQNTRPSVANFNRNPHTQQAPVHHLHSESPGLKEHNEGEITTSQSRMLQDDPRRTKHQIEFPKQSNISGAAGNIDLKKLLNSGTPTDMLKNILDKIPSQANSQQITRETHSGKYNAATVLQLSYRNTHQRSDNTLRLSSTAATESHYDEGKSHGAHRGTADTPVFDAWNEVTRHNVSAENSGENVIAQSQIYNFRNQSYYAESHVYSDNYHRPSVSDKHVDNDEMNSRTRPSYDSQPQFSSQADKHVSHSGASSQHHAYQSSPLSSHATISRRHSMNQSTITETSSPEFPTYYPSIHSPKSETNSRHAAYHADRQTTSIVSGTHHHPAYPPTSQVTTSTVFLGEIPSYQSGIQSSTATSITMDSNLHSTNSAIGQHPLEHQSSINSKTSSRLHLPYPAGKQAYNTPAGFNDTRSNSSWFMNKVKTIVNLPNLSLSKFNRELAIILKDKPAQYKFSKTDLLTVKELQTLGSLNVSEALFLSTLKGKFLGV